MGRKGSNQTKQKTKKNTPITCQEEDVVVVVVVVVADTFVTVVIAVVTFAFYCG